MNNIEDNMHEEESMDDILKYVRSAIVEKELKTYFQMQYPSDDAQDDVFELSKNMLVEREDVPYLSGLWNFNDVAKKMMKKYRNYFGRQHLEVVRVRVKEENNT